MNKLADTIKKRYEAADDFLVNKRDLWDELENAFISRLSDGLSAGAKSKVFDPKLSTYIIERSNRVMAQLGMGKFKPIGKEDEFSSKLMNLTVDKYVVPNANAQFPLLTKFRMIDRYSQVYGNFYALVDWDMKRNGYSGPDLFLINIRDIFPQVGAMSLEDSDYVIVRSWKPMSYFENLDKKQYKHLDKLITSLKSGAKGKADRDDDDKTKRETSQYPSGQPTKGDDYIEVLSMYERDRWVDYVPAAKDNGILRDIKNPHDNDEFPVVCKYSIPLIDDIFGTSDMERGLPLQKTTNSLWNLYLDSVRYSIKPPVALNKDAIVASTIKWGAAAKWLVRGNPANAFSPVNLNPQGTQTFNNVYQVAQAAILNMMGTTTTATTKETDAGFGKTPQALEMQQARENTGDASDRYFMEQFVTEVMKKFANLIVKKQSSKIQIRMFKSEIDELAKAYPEQVKELYNEKKGMLVLDKKSTGNTMYDYELVPGSTYMIDQGNQMKNLQSFLQFYSQNFQFIDAKLQEKNKRVEFDELFKRIFVNGGIQDWDKIISELSEEDVVKQTIEQDKQQFMAALQQVQQGMPIGQVPTDPNMGMQQGQPVQGQPMPPEMNGQM